MVSQRTSLYRRVHRARACGVLLPVHDRDLSILHAFLHGMPAWPSIYLHLVIVAAAAGRDVDLINRWYSMLLPDGTSLRYRAARPAGGSSLSCIRCQSVGATNNETYIRPDRTRVSRWRAKMAVDDIVVMCDQVIVIYVYPPGLLPGRRKMC